MADLSPAAQAVFSAWAKPVAVDRSLVISGQALQFQAQAAVAAALRAAADQVVPVSEPPQRSDFSDLSVYQWAVDVYAYDDATRRKLLAIAAELEGKQ